MNEFILVPEQKQSISQQTIQIAEILQMSAQELDAYLGELMLSNPLIDPDASYQSDSEPLSVHVDEVDRWEDTDHHGQPPEQPMELQIPRAGMSQSQRLFMQLLPYVKTPRDERILRFLTESLDERGFLAGDTGELCETLRLKENELERYIQILHHLEPAGLGARSLQECLLLQLENSDSPHVSLARRLVSQHFRELAEGRSKQLARSLNVKESQMQKALALIQSLNPRPANELEADESPVYIRPDILVERGQDGFEIRLRHGNIHRLLAESSYLALAQDGDPEVRAYIREKKQNIDWMNHCLEQRETTLMRLAAELVSRQQAFFLNGPGSLNPLDQVTLSEALDVSPSTVSRAVREKYIECAWGVFPLKALFPRAVQSNGGTTVQQIKEQIRNLIQEEDRRHPLSDQRLCDILSAEGFRLSRRVIAKYRGELGIPDTSRRRQRPSA